MIISKLFVLGDVLIQTQKRIAADVSVTKTHMQKLEGLMMNVEGQIGSLDGKMGSLDGKIGALEGKLVCYTCIDI